MTRTIDQSTTARRERCVVASLLDAPFSKWGPNLSTAIAYAPSAWEDVQAGLLAEAIGKCVKSGRAPTIVTLCEYLSPNGQQWVAHSEFYQGGLPLDLAEIEAKDLVKRYAGKRLVRLLAEAHQEAKDHPEDATGIAVGLKVKLEDFV